MSTPYLLFLPKKKPLVIASEDLTSAWLASQLSLLQETPLDFYIVLAYNSTYVLLHYHK